MDPSTAQHQSFEQAMTTQSLEDMMGSTKAEQEKKLLTRPQPEQLKCPRCDSSNTKFCYYNNYSLTQPRYFCKACRRYWTKGGSLRNVPVGGGCRKNKRSSSSSSSSSSRRSQQQDQVFNNSNPLSSFPMLPSLSYDSNDLTLAFGGLNKQPTRQLRVDDHDTSILGNLNSLTNNNHNPAFLDVLRNAGFLENPNGFQHNFYYGYGNGNMGGGGVEQNGSRSEEMVFPFEDMSGGSTTAATVMTTAKQETYNGRDGENRLFFNFPWQYGEGNMGNVDSGRESWNGLGSSWHGLVNSSLM